MSGRHEESLTVSLALQPIAGHPGLKLNHELALSSLGSVGDEDSLPSSTYWKENHGGSLSCIRSQWKLYPKQTMKRLEIET